MNSCIRIQPESTWLCKKPQDVSIDRLKLFYPEESSDPRLTQAPPEDADLSRPGDETAEHVEVEDERDDWVGPDPAPAGPQVPVDHMFGPAVAPPAAPVVVPPLGQQQQPARGQRPRGQGVVARNAAAMAAGTVAGGAARAAGAGAAAQPATPPARRGPGRPPSPATAGEKPERFRLAQEACV